MTTDNNPLLYKSGIAPFDRIEPTHVVSAVTQTLDAAHAEFNRIESTLKQKAGVALEAILDTLDDIDEAIHKVWSPVSHFYGVKNSPELRTAYETVQPKLVEFGLRASQSRPLYEAYQSIRHNEAAWKKLTRAKQRIIEQRLFSARKSGVGLDGKDKERFNEYSQELAQLSTKFSNNVLDSTKAWSMILTTAEEVAGLVPHTLESAAQDYATHEKNAVANAEKGPWRFTLDATSYIPFMEFSTMRDLREKMYRARIALASEGQWDNAPIIDRILKLRTELARLVGFSSYGEMSVASKMSGKVEAVDKLLEELLGASSAAGAKEHKELEAFAKAKGCDYALLEWDIPYWSERLKEERYEYNEDELRPFFPIETVLSGMFRLVQDVFGIRVEAADGAAPIWHPDVRFFKIFDMASKAHIASFYLDPYARPATKRAGAWMDDCVCRREKNGHVEIPVAFLVCNGTPPVAGKPGLMNFDQVNTLFHEFGHGLQHMLTRVGEMSVAGISGIEWDAVELASQFMENWLYHIPTLKNISGHYETGAPLPQEYIDKILAAKNFRSATAMLRQLQFGMIDMELHHRFEGNGAETPFEVAMRIAKRTSPLPPRPENKTLCSFSHIFAGGYSAGYYSYKWAEVLSADAFAAFEDAGLDRPHAIAEVGRRYRDTVLSMGGAEHPMIVFKKFRGREPTTEALLKHSGLV